MFRIGTVSDAALAEVAHRSEGDEVTYHGVGATMSGVRPLGYHHERHGIALPAGPATFDRAVDGLRRWRAHLGAGIGVAPLDPPAEGATVALRIGMGPVTVLAPCRVVAVRDDDGTYGFAYGTLPGHPEEGEEAFVVERASDGVVTFRVVVFSRPAELLPRLGGPLTHVVQRVAARRYLDALRRHVIAPDAR